MQTLRLLKTDAESGGHEGDVLSCGYTADGQYVLSAGWDGCLRLWDAGQGVPVGEIKVGSKPVSACGVTPDGKRWLAGSMDGLLGQWDPHTHRQLSIFLAHTRPISGLVFSGDGACLATSSWDTNITLWNALSEREGRTLAGHTDIVAGCRFTPDGKQLASWSYDGTVRLWDVGWGKQQALLRGHGDRVTAGAVSPDGRWLATGSRDQTLRLWDLPGGEEAGSLKLRGEVRACFFLLDAETLVAADVEGRLTLHALPDLEVRSELATRLPVQCADLAPTGSQFALGCTDGKLRFVAVDGFDSIPLVITATQTYRARPGNVLQRLLGQKKMTHAFECICPACRRSFELSGHRPGQPAPCPHCRRSLRLSPFVRVAEPAGR